MLTKMYFAMSALYSLFVCRGKHQWSNDHRMKRARWPEPMNLGVPLWSDDDYCMKCARWKDRPGFSL